MAKRLYSFMVPILVEDPIGDAMLVLNTNWDSTDGNITLGQNPDGWVGEWHMGDGSTQNRAGLPVLHTYPSSLDGQTKQIKAYGTYHATNQLLLHGRKLTGMLDLSKLTEYKGIYDFNTNNLSGVKFPTVTALVGQVNGNNNPNLTGIVDLSTFLGGHGHIIFTGTAITGFISANDETSKGYGLRDTPNLQSILINTKILNIDTSASSSLTVINARKVQTNAASLFRVEGGTVLTRINSDTEGVCDLTNLKGGINYIVLMTNVTSVTLAPEASAGTCTTTSIGSPNVTSINLGGQKFSGNMHLQGCPNLASLNIGSSSNTLNQFFAYSTKLNQTYGFGTKILPRTIRLEHTWHSQANIDQNIDDIYVNAGAFNNTVGKTANFSGPTNSAPSGVYQAPVGFVQGGADGTPVSAQEKRFVLQTQTNPDGTLKYKWTINVAS